MMAQRKNPLLQQSDIVRISIPASVAADLGSFQKSIAELADRLGCRPCFSGADCLFTIEKNFVVDPELNIRNAGLSLRHSAALPQDPIPTITLNPVIVTMPDSVSGNLDSVFNVVASIAGRLGCGECTSGFDVLYRRERELIINEALEINAW